jgi:hypothetical protein
MTDKPPPRDWDKELAEIDKLIARQPVPIQPAPAAEPPTRRAAESSPSRRASPPASREEVPRHRLVLTTWLRVLLALVVAAAMTQWPYAHGCGLQLVWYLGAAAGVILAGLWGSVISWKRRMPGAHVVSLLVTLWGAFLAGQVVLDRTAYPKVQRTWACPAAPSAS